MGPPSSMDIMQKPFPHVIIDDFLPDDFFIDLCGSLEDIKLERKEADLFQFDQSENLSLTKNVVLKELQEKLLVLKPELKKRFAVTLSHIDMFAAFYYDTDYLLPHDDRLESRKVAYTLYIAAPDEGGELALISKKSPHKKSLVDIVPNRLVLFQVSEDSWHEVEEVRGDLPRISITGWFH